MTVAANSGEALLHWRDSWRAAASPLLIVDNGSSDGFPEKSGVPLIRAPGNIGFGPGINLGARAVDTRLILITNPDTLPENPGELQRLLSFHETGTLSGGLLVNRRGEPEPSGGVWPTVSWVAGQIPFRARRLWREDRVDWVQGALILTETRCFLHNLQGFHRDFPLYFEDVDLCARALDLGVATRFDRRARFVHIEGSGAPSAPGVRISCFHWGLWRWFEGHRPASAAKVRRLLRAKCLLRLLILPRNSPVRKGYSLALGSLTRGEPPSLPSL